MSDKLDFVISKVFPVVSIIASGVLFAYDYTLTNHLDVYKNTIDRNQAEIGRNLVHLEKLDKRLSLIEDNLYKFGESIHTSTELKNSDLESKINQITVVISEHHSKLELMRETLTELLNEPIRQ